MKLRHHDSTRPSDRQHLSPATSSKCCRAECARHRAVPMLYWPSVCRVNGNLAEWKLDNGTMSINECISTEKITTISAVKYVFFLAIWIIYDSESWLVKILSCLTFSLNLSVLVALINTLHRVKYISEGLNECNPQDLYQFTKLTIRFIKRRAQFKCTVAQVLPVLQPTCTTPSSQPRMTSCLPILNLKGLSLSRDESNLRPSVREPV